MINCGYLSGQDEVWEILRDEACNICGLDQANVTQQIKSDLKAGDDNNNKGLLSCLATLLVSELMGLLPTCVGSLGSQAPDPFG